ncbi:hypothetical protein [Patiriisocius marinistellae]|nr:hypothetical protein [Patiriisocius marinistellae]
MNILDSLRRPYFAVFLSALILFVSCEKAILETNESMPVQTAELNRSTNAFNYEVYNELIRSSDLSEISTTLINNEVGEMRTVEKSKTILDITNAHFGSDIELPEEFHEITDSDAEYILDVSLANGWVNQVDIDLIRQFETDINNSDFDTALRNYENTVLSLRLDSKEFAKKNNLANSLRAMNHYNPEGFNKVDSCFTAVLSLTLATVSLLTCIAVWPCFFAGAAYTLAYINYIDQCTD